MATHSIHDPDCGIGFDMRNAHLYHDSDDEDEEIDDRYKPRPYTPKNDSDCGCCYMIVIAVILFIGSIIGYSLGSSFTAPQPFEPITNAPKPTINNNIYDTPSPTRKDPFHNHNRGQKGGITAIFDSQPTPIDIAAVIQKPVFEPNAIAKPVFEPTAMVAVIQKPAFEPTPIAAVVEKPVFEATAISVPSPKVNDVDFDIKEINNKYDLYFNHKTLQIDNENDVGDSSILSKIVLDGYSIGHIFSHSQQFNVRYPASSKKYDVNQYRTWCFHFYLYKYPMAQIDITFNSFQLERGFDRILIRHFNQSFLDPPFVIAGRGAFDEKKHSWIMPQRITYHLTQNHFKSICIEMETDDSVGLNGVDFDVTIKYDKCEWSEYTECTIVDESKKHWDRGPFYDGTCGIGVTQRHRTKKECINNDNTDIDGPQYCLKAPCETVDNFNNPKGIPSNIRYGWANHTTFYNGVGTLDAKYPDLLRILTAHPSTPISFNNINAVKEYLLGETFVALYQSYPQYHVNPNGHKFDLDYIINCLENKKAEILAQHINEEVLTIPVLSIKNIDKTRSWLGARLTHSLLIGRTFTMIFTGSSNTAGHDNQFSSTYPMQLQSRLRTLWSDIGVDGAAINIRNEAVGGAPKTDTMAWHIHARSSETVAYPYNVASGGFKRNEDIIFWESFMNDGGRPPGIATEEQLRSTALLNAIWGGMNSINNVPKDKCGPKPFKSLRPPKHLTRDKLFDSFTDIYGEFMGLIEMDFDTFTYAVCNETKYQTLKINWHPNAIGHRCEADILSYLLLTAATDFMKNNKKTIKNKKNDKNVNALDDWLNNKSGNWGTQYIESIKKSDNKLFPSPKYCREFCSQTIAPFALKTVEPNEWNTAYRLTDYLVYNYTEMDINTTFDTIKLLQWNGWRYYTREKGPSHYPQDRTGKIGSMDRKPTVSINSNVWKQRFKQFNGNISEWRKYVLDNDYDVKIAFLVPEIGNHSILAFTGEGGRNFYGVRMESEQIGIDLETMDRKNKVNKKYDYKYDFSKSLTAQRKCMKYQRGCVFHHISPGKYIMRYYPMNMTKDDIPGLVQIIAF